MGLMSPGGKVQQLCLPRLLLQTLEAKVLLLEDRFTKQMHTLSWLVPSDSPCPSKASPSPERLARFEPFGLASGHLGVGYFLFLYGSRCLLLFFT